MLGTNIIARTALFAVPWRVTALIDVIVGELKIVKRCRMRLN
jgi:hypothetical protein